MDLYPSIDIRAGKVVRLYQGDYDQETVYGDDPIAVAKSYEAAGAPWVHVVDLDAARGDGSNRDLVVAVAGAVGTPVQVGGGQRDGSLLDAGVRRVVMGSVAVSDPELVERLAREYPGRVAIGMDHRDGEIMVRGWEQGSGVTLDDLVQRYAAAGAAAFVVTNIAGDGTLQGPDTAGLAKLVAATDVPVVASGGVGTLDDLRALAAIPGLAGAIVGKALYEGRFTVEEAVAACAA
ncbi:MAG: 1-(5-phosphoribosyl)-5-[(5-phosphoribosylamino)methylideneamino]imidazole-4-carboxamide isomerase [Actinobacteria bacterium]|nr:1-(5-phosphoribosyl)-5-[(5-phosphoribosylamino)methylideneamino]imidazole-4-carboxamide isomerase [Actinomycetota bacterium]MBV9662319.1 1-(5-phosphoribosyl)-5-[(5-phosphoribosylamino)methylideneamino]imidazole-4-carboxamide isomerase [Actinomycetota bacterium]MBV9934771.1 1-(5-phosphoribosyl)-5-[(5-phosphoribosylamino)methylideneamino]imidazole-4-carboxamide isomerase [Actinomycetota bacterium]